MSVDFRIFAASLFVKANRERMIHFKPKVPNTWGKSFLTSVMGTTISILLTLVSRDEDGSVESRYLKRVKDSDAVNK